MRMQSYCLWYQGEKVTSGAVVSSTRVSNVSWFRVYFRKLNKEGRTTHMRNLGGQRENTSGSI